MTPLAGRIALVTGAGTGIGKSAALALIDAGYAVVLAGRRREPLEGTAREAEARALLNDSQADRDLLADGLAGVLAAGLGVPTVVVTLGESGSVLHASGVTRRSPAQEAETVDTTGASDAFKATFAAHITAGVPEADAIQAAQAAAAWAIRHPGGHESMFRPNR